MAKKIDPKAKAKKQKIYAAVGGVLLLVILVCVILGKILSKIPGKSRIHRKPCLRFRGEHGR